MKLVARAVERNLLDACLFRLLGDAAPSLGGATRDFRDVDAAAMAATVKQRLGWAERRVDGIFLIEEATEWEDYNPDEDDEIGYELPRFRFHQIAAVDPIDVEPLRQQIVPQHPGESGIIFRDENTPAL